MLANGKAVGFFRASLRRAGEMMSRCVGLKSLSAIQHTTYWWPSTSGGRKGFQVSQIVLCNEDGSVKIGDDTMNRSVTFQIWPGLRSRGMREASSIQGM